jgi:hypothetical protein
MYVQYGYVVRPYHLEDPFDESYFSSLGRSEDFGVWRSVTTDKGTDQDKSRFNRMPFTLFVFSEP